MLHKLSFAIFLLTLSQFAAGQVLRPGKCPLVTRMKEFDLKAYTGFWYQYAEYPFFWEIGYKCSFAEYTDRGDGTVFVHNGATNVMTGAPFSMDGAAKVLEPGVFAVAFFAGDSETEPNYQILGTDYKSFAVVYSCKNLPFLHTQYLWILTREAWPSEETVEAAMKVIESNNLSKKQIKITNQIDCAPRE